MTAFALAYPSPEEALPPSGCGASSERVRIANAALDRLWVNGWATVPSLDPDHLIAKAATISAIAPDADDRDVGWRTRLAVLCDDLERCAQLNALGRTLAHGQLVAALVARLRAHALWRRHPEIADQPLPAPIIVVGQMRSGSTRMQRLLACDPRLAFTRFYESWNPIPASPDAERPGAIDGRKWKGWLGLTCARLLNPGFAAIHPTAWHAPDEEIGLHNLSIYGSAFEAQWRVPHYTASVEQADAVPVYREFRLLLQTLAWLRGPAAPRPWILKVPQFMQDLPALLHVFPDARLIHLHRRTEDVLASSASLVCNQMRLQSDRVDPHGIGHEWSRKVRLREDRAAAARAAATVPQIDVHYDAVTRNWEHEMRRVYRMLDLPLDDRVLATMQRYVRASDPARRARHVYDAQRFGLGAVPGDLVPTP